MAPHKRPAPDEEKNDTSTKRQRAPDMSTATGDSGKNAKAAAQIAAAKARIAEMMKQQKANQAISQPRPPTLGSDIAARIAASKAKLVEKSRGTVFEDNVKKMAQANQDALLARGGLKVGLHPSLLGDDSNSADAGKRQNTSSGGNRRGGLMQPKFASTIANLNRQTAQHIPTKKLLPKSEALQIYRQPVESDFIASTENPYYDPKLDSSYAVQKERKSRYITFNVPGKFVEEAQKVRAAARMEELKRKIEEKAKKAGLEEDLDIGEREALIVAMPPEVEWWDESYTTNKSYDDIERGVLKINDEEVISLYIQHPIPIPPLSITNAPAPKSVMLTHKEMAKSRRQRRAEEQKERRGQQALGLIPMDPPKVKLSNLMRVLANDAIKDPTAVERRVKKEVQARAIKHLQDNESRKLSKDEKHAKDESKKEDDAARGIHCVMYRIGDFSHSQHKFKVNKNASQLGLTGIIILNPRINIVIAEGGRQGIKRYKRLMDNRINWNDFSKSLAIDEDDTDMKEQERSGENKCELLWEGELKNRNFKKWIGEREASNDAAARNWLGKQAEHFWRLAVKKEAE